MTTMKKKKVLGGGNFTQMFISFKTWFYHMETKWQKRFRFARTYAQVFMNFGTFKYFSSPNLWIWNTNLGVKLTDAIRTAPLGAACGILFRLSYLYRILYTSVSLGWLKTWKTPSTNLFKEMLVQYYVERRARQHFCGVI